ncbi:hypothetical protein R9X47_21745 [Wukongibacter baidiensis]|uniref:hypothetical protein n=1 Tax=Wukongibacter baidiensis TaxID=1723361 RepID=UPI003D7FEE6A
MLKDVLVSLWDIVDMVMSLEIPLFEYKITFWNIFYFSVTFYFLLVFFFGLSGTKRGE